MPIVVLFPYVLLFLGLFELVRALDLGNNDLALIVPYTARNLPLTKTSGDTSPAL